jgi:hypothetical protein
VFSRRFSAAGQSGWMAYSILTGLVFLAGFVGVASGSGNSWSVIVFWIAVLLAWSWITAISLRFRHATRLD